MHPALARPSGRAVGSTDIPQLTLRFGPDGSRSGSILAPYKAISAIWNATQRMKVGRALIWEHRGAYVSASLGPVRIAGGAATNTAEKDKNGNSVLKPKCGIHALRHFLAAWLISDRARGRMESSNLRMCAAPPPLGGLACRLRGGVEVAVEIRVADI